MKQTKQTYLVALALGVALPCSVFALSGELQCPAPSQIICTGLTRSAASCVAIVGGVTLHAMGSGSPETWVQPTTFQGANCLPSDKPGQCQIWCLYGLPSVNNEPSLSVKSPLALLSSTTSSGWFWHDKNAATCQGNSNPANCTFNFAS